MAKLFCPFSGSILLACLAVCTLAPGSPGQAEEPAEAASLDFEETVVAGGPSDFMEVRRLVLRGSNFEIGKKLGQIAYQRLKTGPIPYPNRRRTIAQIGYFEKYFPTHLERMRGVAAAFGTDLENNAMNFSTLFYGFMPGGCSAVFYPPGVMAGGRGVLSRCLDFTTGALMGNVPEPGETPVCARPFLIEMHPDEGYASLALYCYDLLGGVVDGINSEGLCIALLADDDITNQFGRDPFMGFQPGFTELQVLRYLLDTCANVEEAKNAMVEAKLYYNLASNHYIVSDAAGESFLWENTQMMHYGHIIEGRGEPLITTNFSQHMYPDLDNLPEKFNRFHSLRTRCREHEGEYDLDFVKSANREVMFNTGGPHAEGYALVRTIWHSLYFPSERRMEVDFYLGEKDDPDAPGGTSARRSGYLSFTLGE